MTVPIGGPGEGTTNAPSDIESALTTWGSPTETSENQIPMHDGEELDGDQSTESQALYEQVSRLCAKVNKLYSERAASLPMEIQVEPAAMPHQNPYGDSHGSEPAEPVLPSQDQEPTALLGPSAPPDESPSPKRCDHTKQAGCSSRWKHGSTRKHRRPGPHAATAGG